MESRNARWATMAITPTNRIPTLLSLRSETDTHLVLIFLVLVFILLPSEAEKSTASFLALGIDTPVHRSVGAYSSEIVWAGSRRPHSS